MLSNVDFSHHESMHHDDTDVALDCIVQWHAVSPNRNGAKSVRERNVFDAEITGPACRWHSTKRSRDEVLCDDDTWGEIEIKSVSYSKCCVCVAYVVSMPSQFLSPVYGQRQCGILH